MGATSISFGRLDDVLLCIGLVTMPRLEFWIGCDPAGIVGRPCLLRGGYCVVRGLVRDENWRPCLLYPLVVCCVEDLVPWKMGGISVMEIGAGLPCPTSEGSITYSLGRIMRIILLS